jgi:hypothetical protein
MLALLNVTWSAVDTEAKFLIVVGIIYNWTTTIMAFVHKSASRIKTTGELFPVDNENKDNKQV